MRKVGTLVSGVPVIGFEDLKRHHGDSVVVITAARYRHELREQFLGAGLEEDNLCCADASAEFIYMYALLGTHLATLFWQRGCDPSRRKPFLLDRQEEVAKAHDLLADEKSSGLYVTYLALMLTDGHFELFRRFIEDFSEGYRRFGLTGYDGTLEYDFYFDNDVLGIEDQEILVDGGAYDGDTVETFLDACRRRGKTGCRVHAFEPDSVLFSRLQAKYGHDANVTCYPLGLWSGPGNLTFVSSQRAFSEMSAHVSKGGDTEIAAVSLDQIFGDKRVTFIKMDIEGAEGEALEGARMTIQKWRPKLAVSVYHTAASIFELPLLVHDLCADYRLYLRHPNCHLCDTMLLAVA